MRTIRLVRHGRAAHARASWLDRVGVVRWLEAYDQAGVVEHDQPPRALRKSPGLVVASDMPRAAESARLLDPAFRTSPLLREATLIIPKMKGRWPLMMWALMIGIRWLRAIRKGEWPSADDYARGEEAADWLDALSADADAITAVTHAGFRRILTPALERRGWTRHGKRKGHHWSVRMLTKP
jgi:hypothetical protein